MSLQWGAFSIMTLPKMSRRTSSKLLSNRSFPDLRVVTPKGAPVWRNMVSFDNWLLLSCDWSGESGCCLYHSSLSATNREQYALHSWRSANSTSLVISSLKSPHGNCKLSYRNKVKLKSVMFCCDLARPRGKYGTIIMGSTSLLEAARPSSMSTALCVLWESWDWVLLSRNDVWLLGNKK